MPFQYIPYPHLLPHYRCIQESECIKSLIYISDDKKSLYQWWKEQQQCKKYRVERKKQVEKEEKENEKEKKEFYAKMPFTLTIEEYNAYKFPRYLDCSINPKYVGRVGTITFTETSIGFRMSYTEKEGLKDAKKDFRESLPKTFNPKEFRNIMKEMAWKVVIKNGTDKVLVEETKEGFTCLLKDKQNNTLFTYRFREV